MFRHAGDTRPGVIQRATVSLDDVLKAQRRIAHVAVRTPLQRSRNAHLYNCSTVIMKLHNLGSQKLQYAMQEHLRRLGWQEIEVIDEDLGRSAAGTATRAGTRRPCTLRGKVTIACCWD